MAVLAMLAASVGIGVTVTASPAFAVTQLCSDFTACTTAPYTDHGWGSHYTDTFSGGWGYWGQAASHNCTNYVAYYEQTVNSMSSSRPSWLLSGPGHDADAWATMAAAGGITVSSVPVVGSVAQWGDFGWNGNAGHVGIVEEVSNGGNTVKVSWDTYSSGPYKWVSLNSTDANTSTTPGWPNNFIYLGGVSGGSSGGNSLDDIYAINRVDTGSGHTATHVINGSNWGLYKLNTGTGLPYTDANWDFELGDLNGDGVLDLWGINRNPGGAHTVVHVLNGANLGQWLQAGNIVLPGTDANWDFELGDYNGDGTPDIYAINRNPGGGNTVVHVVNGVNWGQYLQNGNIVLPGTDSNWSFAVGKR